MHPFRFVRSMSLEALPLAALFFLALICADAGGQTSTQKTAPTSRPTPGSLREQFPEGSIDSDARADAALGVTAGAKVRIDKEYKSEARDCTSKVLVNACIEHARELQRKRLADVNAVELDANRFKRRDKADRLDADRARREAERAANADADAALRSRNRQAFDDRQSQAARDVAARAKSDALKARAPSGGKRKPAIKVAPATDAERNAEQRAKNVVDHTNKLTEGEAHRKDIERRVAAKTAEREKRAADKKAREARDAQAAAAKT